MAKLDKSNGSANQLELPADIKIDFRAMAYIRDKVVPEIQAVLSNARYGGLSEEDKKKIRSVAENRNCIATFFDDSTIVITNGPNDDPHESNGRY